MPNISIADGFGLDLQATLDPKSAFAKYFKQPPSFSALQQDLASLKDIPLVQFPLKSTEIGLAFTQPTTVASNSPQFAGCGAISATLRVVAGGKLFDPDPYDNPIPVPSGSAYLGLGVKVALTPGVDISSGKLAFGFAAGSTLGMSHYRSFTTTPTNPTFKAALQSSLENYTIPLGPDDLAAFGVGDVATIEGTGSLQVSGTVNLLTSVNPLVSVTSAGLPASLEIQECAKIDVKACCTITGDLQVRIQKVEAGKVRLGFYRKRGAEFTVQVEAAAGITAGTGKADFISTVLGAIGGSPLPSGEQLREAGLSEDKQKDIVTALKAAIQRRIELSIQEELHALTSEEAAFLFEIAPADLGADGQSAIQDALRLNLFALSDSAQPFPPGITEVQNLLTSTRKKGQALKINLLGIYNYTSISDLTLKGTVLTDLASGEVVITDGATATRVSGAVNFLADGDKLRKALAQSFLITAAYRCSGLIAHAPSLKVSYWHFDEHANTDRSTMAANLDVLSSLRLISAAGAQQSLAGNESFGRSTFYLTTDYDDTLSQALFLRSDGTPRPLEEYEQIGRKALQLLIPVGSEDGFRLRPLQDEAVWQQVKETGGTPGNLALLFPDLHSDSQIPVIAGDYLVIEWWAKTMAKMAGSLSAAKRFFSQDPPPATGSPALEKMQADLWRQMGAVASSTHDRFAEPWGLLAMDLASGQKAQVSAQIVSPGITLRLERTI